MEVQNDCARWEMEMEMEMEMGNGKWEMGNGKWEIEFDLKIIY